MSLSALEDNQWDTVPKEPAVVLDKLPKGLTKETKASFWNHYKNVSIGKNLRMKSQINIPV